MPQGLIYENFLISVLGELSQPHQPTTFPGEALTVGQTQMPKYQKGNTKNIAKQV